MYAKENSSVCTSISDNIVVANMMQCIIVLFVEIENLHDFLTHSYSLCILTFDPNTLRTGCFNHIACELS